MTSNTLIIVGADKGGVGKTTISRTLIDYLTSLHIQVRAFDTEFPNGTLNRFHPVQTEIVDIAAVPDQMRVLDGIADTGKSTIIDVRAGLLSSTLQFFQNIGFLEALRRARIKLVLFHVLGPSLASLNEIVDIAWHITDEDYFLVKNYVNDTSYSEWDREAYQEHIQKVRHAKEITIPKLNEIAYEQVEVESVSFVEFIQNERVRQLHSSSFVLRGYVRHWLAQVWAEYDRAGLREVLTVESSIARGEGELIPQKTAGLPRPEFVR